jgi:hypothetical protein
MNTRADEEANAMTEHEVGTREKWLRARKEPATAQEARQ